MSTSSILGLAGSIVGGIVGGTVGGPLGASIGASLGGAAGSYVGAILDPTIIQGPSLNDKKLQTSQYGTMLPYVWGRFRLAGTVDWIGNNGELVEHSQSSGGKGGGTEVETKSYTGSWQIKYCKSTRAGDQALVSIDKHWCDGRVVTESDINPTVYIGHAQQLADSSMEADLGIGEVPADRFVGKEVYNEVQMEQFFNRLPQMEALIRTVAPSNGAITQLANEEAATAWPMYPKIGGWTVDWAADQTLPLPTGVTSEPMIGVGDALGAHRMAPCGAHIIDGSPFTLYQDYTTYPAPVGLTGGDYSLPDPYTIPSLAYTQDYSAWVDICSEAGIDAGRYVRSWTTTMDDTILIVITSDSITAPTDWLWHKIVNGAVVAEGPIAAGNAPSTAIINIGCGRYGDNIVQTVKGVIEPNGMYIWTMYTNAGYVNNPLPELDNEGIALFYIDAADNTLKQYTAVGDIYDSYGGPMAAGPHSGAVWCPAEGYVATITGSQKQYALYTRLTGFGEITLATILADVFELKPSSVGDLALSSSRYDVTAAQSVIVHGCAFNSQMQKRNFIAMLEAAYNFDIVESDDGTDAFLKVVFRGGDPVAEIDDDDLGVHEDGSGAVPLLEIIARVQDWELPARVNVGHYDPDQEYLLGSQFAQRAWPYVDNVTRVDLPIVMSAGEARNIAKRELYRAHLERDTYGFTTSRKWAHLEPTDVVTVQGRHLRLIKKTETPDGIIRWEAVLSAPYIDDQVDDAPAGEGATPIPPSGPKVATQVKFFDVAKVADDHLDVGFYVAAAGELGGSWSGYSLQKSVDGGTTWAEVASTNVATIMGTVAQPIGGFTGGNVFDYSTVIRVTGMTGTLESVTELAALNGDNAFILGNEIGNFTTATQVDATTWDVTGLLRGRRGTEWAMTTHGIDETFALVSTMLNVATPEAEVGQARQYKAVSFGMTLAGATAVTFTNTAQSARCYAPVHVAGGPTASDAVIMECVPRTRSGGAWRDFVDIAQADAPLDLVLEIWDATYTSCARVVSGLSSPTYSYSSADQVTDFGAEQSTYYVTWAQVGRFGLGLRARGTVPGPGSTIDAPADPGDPYDPPADPPVGGGGTDIVLTYPADTDHSTGMRIGDTLVIKFTTTTAPSAGYVSVGTYSGTTYALHIILAEDIAGTTVVKEAYGNPVASIRLGTEFSYSVPLDATTDYYLLVRHETSPGNPSGTPGQPTNIAVTLFTE